MNFVETMFVLQFFGAIGILGAKTYNVMSQGKWYDLKLVFLGLVGYFLCFGIGFIVSLFGYETLIYGQLFRLESWSIVYLMVMFFAELFLNIGATTSGAIQAYDSKKNMAAMAASLEKR